MTRLFPTEDIPGIDPYGCAVVTVEQCEQNKIKHLDEEFYNPVTNPIGYLAHEVSKFASDVLTDALTWWIKTPTPNPDSFAVRLAQSYTWPLVVLILVCSVLVQAIRMALTRKATPLVDIATGMLRYTLAVMLGLTVLGIAVTFIDGMSQWILESSAEPFKETMADVLMYGPVVGPAFALIVGGILAILGIVQWVLAFLRQAGILVLAVFIPIAAAGSINPETRPMLVRVISPCITLVVYKFGAALCFTVGFSFVTKPPSVNQVLPPNTMATEMPELPPEVQTQMMQAGMTGVSVLVLSVVSLGSLLKFFEWATPSMLPGTGGSGGFLSAAAVMSPHVGAAAGALGGDPGAAQESYMAQNGPGDGFSDDGALEGGHGSDLWNTGEQSQSGETANSDQPDGARSESSQNSGPNLDQHLPQGADVGAGAGHGATTEAAGAETVAGAGTGGAVTAAQHGAEAVQSAGNEFGGQPPRGAMP